MTIIAWLVGAALLGAPATALAEEDLPAFTAAAVAAAMQEGLPQRYEGGVSMVAVAAEREVLVVTFDMPAAIAADLDRVAVAREFAGGFCEGGDAAPLFEEGLRVRVDTRIDGGDPIPGILIERCPEARD